MFNRFPYGKAPCVILLVALTAGTLRLWVGWHQTRAEADLVFAIFALNHKQMYDQVVPEFESSHGVRVRQLLVHQRALTSRLQAALQTGAAVPDVVEILNGTMGYFARGPLEDVGFLDLTQRLRAEGLYGTMVESRYSLWQSRGHIFALPHDVHPVALCYRQDLVEQLGIDVTALRTWDDFVAMGKRVTKDLDGDGVPDRYALDVPASGAWGLTLLLLQRGGGLFDQEGHVAFDTPAIRDLILWYIRQTRGPHRIFYECGWGQSLSKAMNDGLVLFYICPDWRSKQFEMDVPNLAGKLRLMPLPAWTEGGRRTSTWGGTGLVITKACKRPELAWEFAKFLYLDPEELGKRFAASNIVPPVKSAWNLPEFDSPRAFYGGQTIGRLYADLAQTVPPSYVSPYSRLAEAKLSDAFLNAADYFERRGDEGLADYTMHELHTGADYVRRMIRRNVFLSPADGDVPGRQQGGR